MSEGARLAAATMEAAHDDRQNHEMGKLCDERSKLRKRVAEIEARAKSLGLKFVDDEKTGSTTWEKIRPWGWKT